MRVAWSFAEQEARCEVCRFAQLGVPSQLFLGLVTNSNCFHRAGHYNRALEEAIQTHKLQWAKDWESKNPLAGGASFTSMIPTQRVSYLTPYD